MLRRGQNLPEFLYRADIVMAEHILVADDVVTADEVASVVSLLNWTIHCRLSFRNGSAAQAQSFRPVEIDAAAYQPFSSSL
jgi:hypothetical protein